MIYYSAFINDNNSQYCGIMREARNVPGSGAGLEGLGGPRADPEVGINDYSEHAVLVGLP